MTFFKSTFTQNTSYEQLARQHKINFFETSAWQNISITESFTSLAESILNSVSSYLVL